MPSNYIPRSLEPVVLKAADQFSAIMTVGPCQSGKTLSLHDHLQSICRYLSSDFQPYGERERNGEPDCSVGCKHFLKLPGKLGMDWGVCANPASPRVGLLTFKHQGCEQFEGDENEIEEK